jgi:hypothetical protein
MNEELYCTNGKKNYKNNESLETSSTIKSTGHKFVNHSTAHASDLSGAEHAGAAAF